MSLISERCYEPLTDDDLARLGAIAAADRVARFARRLRWAVYRDRVISVALCQGAALHYVDGENGVKDLDVWTFYAADAPGPFPARWRTTADFGDSHLGRRAREPDRRRYRGRRVDLIGRSLAAAVDADPIAALTAYLRSGRTESARRLAEKAVVLIDPHALRAEIVWPR